MVGKNPGTFAVGVVAAIDMRRPRIVVAAREPVNVNAFAIFVIVTKLTIIIKTKVFIFCKEELSRSFLH
jgi:hypothetical protein